MLRIFKNYNPFSVILLIIILLCFRLFSFQQSSLPDFVAGGLLWEVVGKILTHTINPSAYGYTILAICLTFIQSLQINKYVINAKLFPENSYLAAFSYILITSLYPSWSHFNSYLLATTFFVSIINQIYKLYFSKTTNVNIFNIGFLAMICVSIQYTFIIYILFLIISLLIVKSINFREWVLFFLGCITPIYLTISGLYLFNALPNYKMWMKDLRFYLHFEFNNNLHVKLTGIGLIIIVLVSLPYLLQQLEKSLIGAKRAWSILILYTIFSIIAALATPGHNYEQWIITLPGVAILATSIWNAKKRYWIPQIFSLLILLLALYNQWFV